MYNLFNSSFPRTPSSLEPMPSPRVLNCHMFADDLPLQVRSKKVKVIHVLRNPKDVAVSFFHFSKKLPMMSFMENKPFETFSEYLPYFTGEYGMCKYTIQGSISVTAYHKLICGFIK